METIYDREFLYIVKDLTFLYVIMWTMIIHLFANKQGSGKCKMFFLMINKICLMKCNTLLEIAE